MRSSLLRTCDSVVFELMSIGIPDIWWERFMATITIKLSGNGRQLPISLDTGTNAWTTISNGLCVSSGSWDSSLLGPNLAEVVLSKDDGITPVVELHNLSSTTGVTGHAAVRCGGTFPVDDPADPVGNYMWEILP